MKFTRGLFQRFPFQAIQVFSPLNFGLSNFPTHEVTLAAFALCSSFTANSLARDGRRPEAEDKFSHQCFLQTQKDPAGNPGSNDNA
jgi:hypothetical protein